MLPEDTDEVGERSSGSSGPLALGVLRLVSVSLEADGEVLCSSRLVDEAISREDE
jgi:hypothetical protein